MRIGSTTADTLQSTHCRRSDYFKHNSLITARPCCSSWRTTHFLPNMVFWSRLSVIECVMTCFASVIFQQVEDERTYLLSMSKNSRYRRSEKVMFASVSDQGGGGGHECGFTHRISSAEMKIYGVWSSWLFIWLTHPVESYMQLSANAPPCVPQFLPSPCRSQGLSKPPDERHPWLAGPPVWVATAPAPGLEIHQPCPQTDLLLRLRCVCGYGGSLCFTLCFWSI